MNAHVSRLFGILAGLALVGCHADPLKDLDGTPSAVVLSLSDLTLNNGTSGTVTASVVDNRSIPLAEPVTFTSSNASVASVTVDASYQPEPATSARAIVSATGLGVTYVVASGAGVHDSTRVIVLPLSFDGALSSSTPAGGSNLTIHGTASLKFDPASVDVSFQGFSALATRFLAKSADSVTVMVPYGPTPGPLTLSGVTLTYLPGQTVTLQTAATVTVTGDYWAGDSSWQTAPDITSLLPALGSTRVLLTTTGRPNAAKCPEVALAFGSTGPCMMFRMTLADTATYSFSVDWLGAATSPDIDVYACADSAVANFGSACFEDGGGGATSAKPQEINQYTFPAGDHWFVIEVFGGGSSDDITVTITRP